MIDVGTQLEPRSPSDPVVRVCGIEGSRYVLSPVEPFGPNFDLDTDGIAAAYVCDDYALAIDQEAESDLWRRFSTEKFDAAAQRQRPPAEPLPSPEQVFAAAADNG